MPDIDQQIAILSRRCERILSDADLRKKLATGRPLRIKLGMDPTAPDLTLGNAVPLKVVRQFQDWGHKAVLIIGDYTARVGDPTGRNVTRKVLTGEEIDANAKRFVEQVKKVVLTDPEHLEIRFNGEWLGKMGLVDIIKLASRKSIAQVLTRDDFAKRYAEGVDIRLHEMLYPLLQGWDSVCIDADVEMGGSDQLFNNLVGREFQKVEGKDGQVVMVTPLLVGLDGVKKMSKSLGNYIGLTDPPGGDGGIFGKVMRVPDTLMASYYQLLTEIPETEYGPMVQSKPRDAKVRLAKLLITWLHDAESAETAERQFMAATHNEIPDDIPELPLVGPGPFKLAPLMVQAKMVASNGEGIRKIKEGAVRLDGKKVEDFQKEWSFDQPTVLQMGSRKFARLIPATGRDPRAGGGY